MSYYCHLDSNENPEHTNLQLYSLQKAAIDWNKLIDSTKNNRIVPKGHLKERLAFILSCLGLSLSQLLGQNCPSPKKEKMDSPGSLLNTLLIRAGVERIKRRSLNRYFEEFLKYYDSIRHFGKNKGEQNYRNVDQLTLKRLERFRHTTIEIWDIVIAMYRKDPKNNIDDFRSIADVVKFKDLA